MSVEIFLEKKLTAENKLFPSRWVSPAIGVSPIQNAVATDQNIPNPVHLIQVCPWNGPESTLGQHSVISIVSLLHVYYSL